MTATTAKEAKARGVATYFTGNPCEAGHVSARWAISRQCVDCMPMDRSPEYVRRMRAAFEAAYLRTIKTGYLHYANHRDDGWWVVPVRDPRASHVEEPAHIKAERVDGQ